MRAPVRFPPHPVLSHAGDELNGLMLDLSRVLAFNEALLDAAAGVNEDAPRCEWTADSVQRISMVGRKLLLFAADKVSIAACRASCFMLRFTGAQDLPRVPCGVDVHQS